MSLAKALMSNEPLREQVSKLRQVVCSLLSVSFDFQGIMLTFLAIWDGQNKLISPCGSCLGFLHVTTSFHCFKFHLTRQTRGSGCWCDGKVGLSPPHPPMGLTSPSSPVSSDPDRSCTRMHFIALYKHRRIRSMHRSHGAVPGAGETRSTMN